MMPRKTRGFTLVELLAVIGILSLLLALLFPGLERARATARAASCRSNLRQIGVAVQAFTTDHGGLFPAYNRGPWTGDYSDPQEGGRHRGRQWDAQIAPYLGLTPGVYPTQPTVFFCPESAPVTGNRPLGHGLSYLYNRMLGWRGYRANENDPGGRDRFGSGSVHTLVAPQRTLLAVEYHYYSPSDYDTPIVQILWPQAANVSMGYIGNVFLGGADRIIGMPTPVYYRQISFRHLDKTHILFADFSVDGRGRSGSDPMTDAFYVPEPGQTGPDAILLHNPPQ